MIELRAVVQRVDEGATVNLHLRDIAVRPFRGAIAAGSSSAVKASTGVFPSLPEEEKRFGTRVKVNTSPSSVSSRGGMTAVTSGASYADVWPIGLFEYATVDFFIEARGCHTEADFLRLEACVDMPFSLVNEEQASSKVEVLKVALTDGSQALASATRVGFMGMEAFPLTKRRAGLD